MRVAVGRILREPSVHFVIAGGLLVAAHQLYVGISRPVIEVTPEWVETLARDFEVKSGHPPDVAERKEMIRGYVENEILFREAKKLGILEDPRVRHLMISVQRENMEPVLPDPSDAELEKMRQLEPGAFHFPAEIGFEHSSFTTVAEIPEGELERLRSGGKGVWPTAMRLPNPLPKTWMPQMEKMFGKEFAGTASRCKLGEWSGPFKSSLGVHFVKVLTYAPSREMPMNQVRSALVSRWMSDKKNAAVTAKANELARDYRIVLPSVP